MNSRDAIKLSINMGDMISMAYLQDLTDEQMMQRPHPDCNHLKWQIGHLIASERMMSNVEMKSTLSSSLNPCSHPIAPKCTAVPNLCAKFDEILPLFSKSPGRIIIKAGKR